MQCFQFQDSNNEFHNCINVEKQREALVLHFSTGLQQHFIKGHPYIPGIWLSHQPAAASRQIQTYCLFLERS